MTEIEIAFAAGIFIIAGIAKGTLGIGLPTIAVSLMSQVMDPRLAVTLAIGPILLTNAIQALRSGHILRTLRRYAAYWVTLGIVISISAMFAQYLSAQAILLIMGIGVITFTLAQLLFHPPPLPPRMHKFGQAIAGTLSGIMGGVTAVWGPPILIYLIAARVDKDEFVRASGTLLTAGAIPLMIAYMWQGELWGERAYVSFALAVPSLIGFAIGEKFREKLDPEKFQTAVLVMFLLLGANIVRRGLMGA